MTIQFTKYHEKYKIGKRINLESINDYKKELQKIEKELAELDIEIEDKILCFFETNYKEKNIDTFIGYTLKEKRIPKDIGTLEVITNSKAEKLLVGRDKRNNLKELYKEIIKYAKNNKIQIRGFFTIILKEEIEIYVEAYDLTKENEDYIYYLNHFKKEIEIDKDLIGTYYIREILPSLKYMFNPNKQKSKLITKYKTLVLKDNGKTNYENITWNKKQLIMTLNNIEIPLPIHKFQYKKEEYLTVLMNETYEYYKSQRPMEYLYKKSHSNNE